MVPHGKSGPKPTPDELTTIPMWIAPLSSEKVSSLSLFVNLAHREDILPGLYTYERSEQTGDSQWQMYYNSANDSTEIVLTVDHDPTCPQKKDRRLNVLKCNQR